MNDDIRAIEIMQDNAEHAADRPTDAEWVKARAGIIGVEKHYEDIGASTGSLEVIRAIDKCLRYSDTLRAISPPEPTEDAVEKLFEGLDDRLDRLLVNDTDSSRFILSGVSAHNITEIAKEWVRSRLRSMPLQDHTTKNEAKPEWMTDPKRLPMIEGSLRTRCEEMRKSAGQARNAYKKEYFGAPWTWFADALDEGAATLEAQLATLLAEDGTK